MIKKLFGQTEEEQFNYLQPRVIALLVGVLLLLTGVVFMKLGFGDVIALIGEAICVIVLLVFGWAIIRGIFGFVTVGALFSLNIVVGVVALILFVSIGYIGGFFVAVIGVCRYLILLKKRKGNR